MSTEQGQVLAWASVDAEGTHGFFRVQPCLLSAGDELVALVALVSNISEMLLGLAL